MSLATRFITDENGEKVGVLLDWQTYQNLVQWELSDPELLHNLSRTELHALANSKLAYADQTRLNDLLARNTDYQLSNREAAELDTLLEQIDELTIIKTRARYTLQKQS